MIMTVAARTVSYWGPLKLRATLLFYRCSMARTSVAKVLPKCGQGVAQLWPRPYKKLPPRTSCLAIIHR